MGDIPVPRAARISAAMSAQSSAVNIMSAIKQSMPASPATSTRFGCEKTYAHNEGVLLCTFASNRSPVSVGKNIVSLVVLYCGRGGGPGDGEGADSALHDLSRRGSSGLPQLCGRADAGQDGPGHRLGAE